MDLHKTNVECKDPMAYKQALSNKRKRYGDLEREHLKTKYKHLQVPPPPKIDEKKIFEFSKKKSY